MQQVTRKPRILQWIIIAAVLYILSYCIITRVVSPAQSASRVVDGFTAYRYFKYDIMYITSTADSYVEIRTGIWSQLDYLCRYLYSPLSNIDGKVFKRVYSPTLYIPGEYNGIEGRPEPGHPEQTEDGIIWVRDESKAAD